MKTRPLVERFWEKVRKSRGCWEWTGSRSEKGYGRIGIRSPRGSKAAHRVSWEIAHGPIPDGLNVLHECDNTGCVRPSHLFLGTQLDNVRDMMTKGRDPFGAFQRAKTHCPQGHPYSADNTIVKKNGDRRCKTCAYARNREWNGTHRDDRSKYNREYRLAQKARDPKAFRKHERERAARMRAKDPDEFLRRQREYNRASYARKKSA